MTDTVTVRRATPSDAGDVQALVEAAYGRYVERIGRRPAPMDQDYADVLASADCWVARLDGRTVGMVAALAEADHVHLDSVAVAEQARGLGVGRRLVEVVVDHARALGVGEVRLYTNEAMTENLTFYPRLGFHETDRRQEDGFRRVYFSRAVPFPPP